MWIWMRNVLTQIGDERIWSVKVTRFKIRKESKFLMNIFPCCAEKLVKNSQSLQDYRILLALNKEETSQFGCYPHMHMQKQPFILIKRCSENMQQIYRRTPMPKCDFNKVALQLYWNRTSPWLFSCKFAAFFQNTSGRLLLNMYDPL